MTENLPSLDGYGLKKTFLDALDGCDGVIIRACLALGIEEKNIEALMDDDQIFKEAIEQITYEHSEASELSHCSPTRVVGIRPHDLHHIINRRLAELPKPTSIRHDTAIKMCRFLGFYRGLGWDTRGACELTGIASATVTGWQKSFPEFSELMEAAQRDSISEVYDMAIKRALDPTSSGDAMRSLILRGRGKVIGFDPVSNNGNVVNVVVQRTPAESDAINHAHQKAVEAQSEIITIESTS